jgi:hypothetical protein
MRKLSCLVRVAATAGLFVAGAAGASTLPDFTAPGIPEPGSPNFSLTGFSGSVIGTPQSGFTLSIVSDPGWGTFNIGGASYAVHHEEIFVTAHFDSHGNLVANPSNSVEIFGSIGGSNHPLRGTTAPGDSWSAQPFEELFAANITGVGVDSGEKALGFSTDFFSGWASQFAPPSGVESLWLYSLTSAWDHGDDHRNHGEGLGSQSWSNFLAELGQGKSLRDARFHNLASITTVPLPGAALLMLGGLTGLWGFARGRRALVLSPVAAS